MRTVLFLAAAASSLLIAAPLAAQTGDASETSPPASGSTPPSATRPGGVMGPGMMGPGATTGYGTMGYGYGMMGPGTGPGAGRPDYAMPMTGMMRTMTPGDHLDGRLAYLKAELKITDAQAPQWGAFEQAARGNAKAAAESRQAILAAGKTLPERLAEEQAAVNRHAAAVSTTKAAVDKLYAVLSPEQKKTADTIVLGPMGMPMGMMP